MPVPTPEVSAETNTANIPKTSVAFSVMGRLIRIAIALPLLALSGWVLLPFAIVPVSSIATTNARVSSVRTTISGQVLRYQVDVGDRVSAGQTILEIVSPSTGGRGSSEKLLKEKFEAAVYETALSTQIAETEKRLRDYDRKVREYNTRASLERDLDRETLSLEATLSGLRQVYGEAYPEVRRINSQIADIKRSRAALAQTSAPANDALSEPPAIGSGVPTLAAKEIKGRTPEMAPLRSRDSNPRSGNLVNPDSDENPVESLRDEASAELTRLRQEKLLAEVRQRSLSGQLADLDQLPVSSADIVTAVKSAVDGIVWSRDVPIGQTVKEGDDLVGIAETNTIQVEGYVDARYARRISVQDKALIYLTSENKRLSGRLTLVQGPGQRNTATESLAIDLKAPSEGLYRVVVQVDAADRSAAWVGKVAKIVFPGADSNLMTRVYSWLSRY